VIKDLKYDEIEKMCSTGKFRVDEKGTGGKERKTVLKKVK
jgi:hypothetical protein